MLQPYLLPMIVILLGAFTQSLTGFGVALVAMSLLASAIGIHNASPLIALVAFTLEGILLLRYRASISLHAIWPLALASVAGIPLGIWALKGLDEAIMVRLLGIVIAGYALYGLVEFKLPKLDSPLWAVAAGFISGMLGGAYNTAGPPVIIYGHCKRWAPDEFKANLQGFFLDIDALVISGHFLARNITPTVWTYYLWALTSIALGIIAGVSLDRLINPTIFRKVVLVLLLVMGGRMLLFG